MRQVLFLALLSLTLNLVNGQFCVQPTPDPNNNKPVPNIYDNDVYQATIERNHMGNTVEIREYYDGLGNVGISIQTAGDYEIRSYCYYPINEAYIVSGDQCNVFKLNESNPIFDNIFATTIIDGKEHIMSPLNTLISNPALKFTYTGVENTVRGIKVDEWRACYYSQDKKKTYKITISYSTANWTTFTLKNAPVQILIETQEDGKDEVVVDNYSVTQFRPFITLEEEDYSTPSGVYCPGRKSLKPLPKLPDHFGFVSEVLTPIGDRNGLIETVGEEYNYRSKLFKFTYDRNDFVATEIHNYNTGLNYTLNKFAGTCDIGFINKDFSIDSVLNGSLVQMRDPMQFFDFDSSNYQFTGFKRRDGVNNDVFVGQRSLAGYNATFEWYFLSYFWNKTDERPSSRPDNYQTPMEVKIFINVPGLGKQVKYNHFFAFEQLRMNLDDYDVSLCYRHLPKKHFMFSLKNDLAKIVQDNEYEFKHSLAYLLHTKARVDILRIAHLAVGYDFDAIHVLFTVYERTEKYGPVEPPKEDVLLVDAEKALKSAFESDQMQIEFSTSDRSDKYTVPSVKDSFKDIPYYDRDGYIQINRDMTKKGHSSVITGFITAIVALLGLAIGVFVVYIIKAKNVKVSYLNP